MSNIAIMKGNIKMRDCKLRCIRRSCSFDKYKIYEIKNNELISEVDSFHTEDYETINDINEDFQAQFEIVKEELPKPLDSLTLSEINSKYGEQCYNEIIEVIDKYSNPLDKVYIDVFKSIVGLVDGATYYQDGDICDSDGEYIFTIKQNLPLGDKQYILQEEIDKYESANR